MTPRQKVRKKKKSISQTIKEVLTFPDMSICRIIAWFALLLSFQFIYSIIFLLELLDDPMETFVPMYFGLQSIALAFSIVALILLKINKCPNEPKDTMYMALTAFIISIGIVFIFPLIIWVTFS